MTSASSARRVLVLVGVVLVDRVAHPEQILLQHRLARADHALAVLRHPHRRQDHDDRHHDQQLDHREAPIGRAMHAAHFDALLTPHSALLLPIPVLRAVERRAVERRVDVEHVLAAPAWSRRACPGTSAAPTRCAGHRIDRDAPQELQLAAGRVVGRGTPSTSVCRSGG